ncbi:glycosyl transferase family 90 [Hymenobacter bucti]|uniref:Glycosyl transferase family 90 n=1 Tax=Hymenobacter bucti TaxID=1844114 RepID=A0ABW4R1H0_9BACT
MLLKLPAAFYRRFKRLLKAFLQPLGFFSRDWRVLLSLSGLRGAIPFNVAEPFTLPHWMHEQVAAELARFRDGITPGRLAVAESFYAGEYHNHFVRYAVQAGRLRILTSQQHFPAYITERFRTMTSVFEALAPTLPELDFILYLGDGFDGWSRGCEAPVLTFSKRPNVDESGLLIPDPLTLALSSQLRLEVKAGCAKHPWESRASVAFWCGTTTGGPFDLSNYTQGVRFRLVERSQARPDLIDAVFTGFHSVTPELEALVRSKGWLGQYVKIADHFRYRYQVLVDGFTSPWPRYFWGLHGDSAILKQESGLCGWFDAGLKPWIHYVPLASDLSDLEERISWAQAHDDEVRAITVRAQRFAYTDLTDAVMLGYMRLLLTEYAKLLRPHG